MPLQALLVFLIRGLDMTERIGTTPFGGGKMSARLFKRQIDVAERQQALQGGEGGNETGRADKWRLLRALTEAKAHYGLNDRAIALLEAMASFAAERELDGAKPIIVFPSNRELSLRARGMSPATIRRHVAALVEAGLIFRRDSANGKRYCRRGDHGAVEEAFGFDLAPLALKADEIFALAEQAREDDKLLRAIRTEITLHQRDIAKILEIALEEGRAGDWLDFSIQLAGIRSTLTRKTEIETLRQTKSDLNLLRHKVETLYLEALSEEEMSANDSQIERHIQNSKSEQLLESSGNEKEKAEAPQRKALVSLARLQKVCPQILDYAREGVRGWSDLIKTADLVRSMLGVSPDAWRKARAAMGEEAAAVVIAVMLERAEEIKSPGGYLRNLTDKAEVGAFSILPMLQALERKTK
ncbi:plasmid replication protein RepC [Rhizobium sp. TRM95796]|uniref:plasmid replication protein RepC n=1 Tax=Rhizobium sp. TRM95796 TaxID=2979862 RepID=UPI002988008A|nr:plasmid replication protein RepC [Rhizobium sp. TRM95796]